MANPSGAQPCAAPFDFVLEGRGPLGDFSLGRTDVSARIRQAEQGQIHELRVRAEPCLGQHMGNVQRQRMTERAAQVTRLRPSHRSGPSAAAAGAVGHAPGVPPTARTLQQGAVPRATFSLYLGPGEFENRPERAGGGTKSRGREDRPFSSSRPKPRRPRPADHPPALLRLEAPPPITSRGRTSVTTSAAATLRSTEAEWLQSPAGSGPISLTVKVASNRRRGIS